MNASLSHYHLVELGEKHLDVPQHRPARTVPREVRLRPDVPVRTVPLLLVLQVERRHRGMVTHLLRHVAHTTLPSVHHARERLSDDRVVRLLAALLLNEIENSHVGFIVPTR